MLHSGKSFAWVAPSVTPERRVQPTPLGRLSARYAPWHHVSVGSDWVRFVSRCQQVLGELVEGRPEPFKALSSHADDVAIMGAFGGYEQGGEQVSGRLDQHYTAPTPERTSLGSWNLARPARQPGVRHGRSLKISDRPQPQSGTSKIAECRGEDGAMWPLRLRTR